MKEVEIRTCTYEDIPSVLNLLAQLSEVADTSARISLQQVRGTFDEMNRYPEIYTSLVACELGQVVGFMSLMFYKTPFHAGGTALINELVVNSTYRGRGIGKQLVHRARAEAMQRGMDELEVGTQRSNLQAQKFYKSCGFDEEYLLLGMEF